MQNTVYAVAKRMASTQYDFIVIEHNGNRERLKLENLYVRGWCCGKAYDLKNKNNAKYIAVENPRDSRHVNLGFEKNTRRARSHDGLKLVWGCLVTDWRLTKWRKRCAPHGTQSRSMLCVVRN